jgi:hypothetical protein
MKTAAHEAPVRKTTSKAVTEGVHRPGMPHGVPDDDIRLCAYTKWESAGKPAGDGVQFWLEAERELRAVAGMRIDYSRS